MASRVEEAGKTARILLGYLPSVLESAQYEQYCPPGAGGAGASAAELPRIAADIAPRCYPLGHNA
jgi:hypothetical protein